MYIKLFHFVMIPAIIQPEKAIYSTISNFVEAYPQHISEQFGHLLCI